MPVRSTSTHNAMPYLWYISVISSHPFKMHAFLTSFMHSTCPTNRILFHLISLTIYSEQFILRSSSLHNFLQFSVTFSHLAPNILHNIQILLAHIKFFLWSETLNPLFIQNNWGNYISLYSTLYILDRRKNVVISSLKMCNPFFVESHDEAGGDIVVP